MLHATRKLSVRTWLLIIFSYVFCLSFGFGGALVVTVVALADFIVGGNVGSAESDGRRRRWLWLGLAVTLAPLAFFKCSAFVAGIVATILHPRGIRVLVPSNPISRSLGSRTLHLPG